MKATSLFDQRLTLAEGEFVELVVWRVPVPVRGSAHDAKYRLAYVVEGECVVRYDNEAGKGDHKHIDGRELPYRFTSVADLVADFLADVQARRPK